MSITIRELKKNQNQIENNVEQKDLNNQIENTAKEDDTTPPNSFNYKILNDPALHDINTMDPGLHSRTGNLENKFKYSELSQFAELAVEGAITDSILKETIENSIQEFYPKLCDLFKKNIKFPTTNPKELFSNIGIFRGIVSNGGLSLIKNAETYKNAIQGMILEYCYEQYKLYQNTDQENSNYLKNIEEIINVSDTIIDKRTYESVIQDMMQKYSSEQALILSKLELNEQKLYSLCMTYNRNTRDKSKIKENTAELMNILAQIQMLASQTNLSDKKCPLLFTEKNNSYNDFIRIKKEELQNILFFETGISEFNKLYIEYKKNREKSANIEELDLQKTKDLLEKIKKIVNKYNLQKEQCQSIDDPKITLSYYDFTAKEETILKGIEKTISNKLNNLYIEYKNTLKKIEASEEILKNNNLENMSESDIQNARNNYLKDAERHLGEINKIVNKYKWNERQCESVDNPEATLSYSKFIRTEETRLTNLKEIILKEKYKNYRTAADNAKSDFISAINKLVDINNFVEMFDLGNTECPSTEENQIRNTIPYAAFIETQAYNLKRIKKEIDQEEDKKTKNKFKENCKSLYQKYIKTFDNKVTKDNIRSAIDVINDIERLVKVCGLDNTPCPSKKNPPLYKDFIKSEKNKLETLVPKMKEDLIKQEEELRKELIILNAKQQKAENEESPFKDIKLTKNDEQTKKTKNLLKSNLKKQQEITGIDSSQEKKKKCGESFDQEYLKRQKEFDSLNGMDFLKLYTKNTKIPQYQLKEIVDNDSLTELHKIQKQVSVEINEQQGRQRE